MALASAACGGGTNQEGPVDNEGDETYQSGAHIYYAMEEASALKDVKTGNQFPVSYVFSDAKYKSPRQPGNAKGVRGKGMRFDGYSTSADTLPTQEYGSFTVSLWVAPDAFALQTDNRGQVLLTSYDTLGGFELRIYNYGEWGFRAATDMGSVQVRSGDRALQLYRWNHLVAVFDGEAHKLTLYQNGEEVAKSSCPGSKALASTKQLRVGKGYDGAIVADTFDRSMYSGLLDELEIYDRALSSEQIADKYGSLAQAAQQLGVYTDLWMNYETLADDRYAPQYHLRTPLHWQNETYGLFYYNGYYHAFCQQNVLGPYYTDGQRWGHFVSRDLVHWESLVPALLPEDNGIDNTHVFSGGATLDKNGKPVLFYTGVNYEASKLNQISTARPRDPNDPWLEQWDKSGKVVVEQGSVSTRDNFRDPFIYCENGTYYMLIGGTEPTTGDGAIYCYRATDDTLENWEYLSLLHTARRNKYPVLGTCYELPNLFKVQNESKTITKYLLMISPIGGTVNGVYYWLGDFNAQTGTFTPEQEAPTRYDVGPVSQVLCPSGFYDARTDRNLFLTMSRTGMEGGESYESGWATVMTLVKQLSLDDAGNLLARPIEEYEALYGEKLVDVSGNYTVQEANLLLEGVGADMLMLRVEVDAQGASKVGLNVKYKAGGEYVDISYTTDTQQLYISAARSSLDMRHNGAGGGTVPVEGNLVFTVFVDRAMVEAYLNDRNQVTAFGYNTAQQANGVRLYSEGGSPLIKSIRAYRMNSAYGETVPAYWG